MAYFGLSGSFDLMKNLNLEKVYKHILLYQPISKAKISQLSGLNKMTVSNCVDYLAEKGVTKTLGVTDSARGRPPTLIGINGDAGVYIGIETGLVNSKLLVTDLAGIPLEQDTFEGIGYEPPVFMQVLSSLIQSLKKKYNALQLGVVGVGIAIPGHYNQQTGVIEFALDRMPWQGFPIKKELIKLNPDTHFYFQTGANFGALGEIHFGKSNPSETLAYVHGTWGLSLGVYSKGELFRGFSGFAGRFGHTIMQMKGKKCACGNKGCLQAYASFQTLFEKIYPDQMFQYKYLRDIQRKLMHNDPVAISAMHEVVQYLSMGIVNIINAYNPSQVCIGGYLGMLINENFINQIKMTVNQMVPESFRSHLSIYNSDLGNHSSTYGCISAVQNHLIEIIVSAAEEE